MKFVLIPAGRFMMGSPDSEAGHQPDETQHEVTISRPFYMGISEVTQEQWQAVMGTRPWDELVFFRESRTNPASCISWADATEFCKRLSAKPGQAGPPFRLPTEAEWEYACRAGTTTRFYFGDDESRLGDYAWWGKNTWAVHEQYSHAVGQKRPNGWGLHDMLGNVCEWCSDWYGDYSRGPVTDPAGPELGRVPVLRGGSWNDDAPENLRCADRIDRGPGNRLGGYGFRVARNLPP
jgi:formylglycine-generating enzyme required for sulfatase activity